MSADEWRGCPVCKKLANEYFNYAKDKLPYDLVEDIKSKMDHILSENIGSWHPSYLTGLIFQSYADSKLDEICNWVECSLDTGNSVRIDYSQSLHSDGTYTLEFAASCTECGHEFTEDMDE
jgi:hypothetical protein